jgi:Protein of unknown function (DUF664).
MQAIDPIIDLFGRVREEVHAVLMGADAETLGFRADPDANTIAWLVWHLTRVQDDHIAHAYDAEQLWTAEGWADRFALPFPATATGYGQSAHDVGQVQVVADLLRGYHDAVSDRTLELLRETSADDLDRVVDTRWDPPVTLAVRLISVASDDLQHVGQAAYVRGLAGRA